MEIRVLGPGCPKCKKLEELAIQAASQLNVPADIQKVTDIIKMSEYGIMSTPALIINGKVKSVGKVPNVAQIMEWIKEEM